MGKEGDATPFAEVTVDNISAALHSCGYQSRGWEVITDRSVAKLVCKAAKLGPFKWLLFEHSSCRAAAGHVQRAHRAPAAGPDFPQPHLLPAPQAHGAGRALPLPHNQRTSLQSALLAMRLLGRCLFVQLWLSQWGIVRAPQHRQTFHTLISPVVGSLLTSST